LLVKRFADWFVDARARSRSRIVAIQRATIKSIAAPTIQRNRNRLSTNDFV
jgi:hypothetical protein